jgi:hypothetical protein
MPKKHSFSQLLGIKEAFRKKAPLFSMHSALEKILRCKGFFSFESPLTPTKAPGVRSAFNLREGS